IFGIFIFLLGCLSCAQDFSVDLAGRHFIRLDKQAVSITVGEKYTIKAIPDSLGSASKTLTWSILDPEVASVTAGDGQTATITGLSAGSTVVKVESTDGSV